MQVLSVREESWEENFKLLETYWRENNNCKVPCKASLGQWLKNQRLRNGSKLNSDKRKRLEALGVVFGSRHTSWDYKYGLLVKHANKHGRNFNNIDYSTGGQFGAAFGKWQSQLKNGAYAKPLNAEQIENDKGM